MCADATQADRTEFQPASRTGRWVQLVPIETTAQTTFLYELAKNEDVAHRWRYTGFVPTRERFVQELFQGVLTQFVVTTRDTGEMIGLVVAYNPDMIHGYAYLGEVMVPAAVGTGVGVEAFYVFTRYLFQVFSLRKLYLEVPEYNLKSFAGGQGRLLHREGVLRGHTHYGGRYWDRHIFAVYRDDLAEGSEPVFGSKRRRGPAPLGPGGRPVGVG
jgi:RimJ/RimL family protein N-acetyltransferase